MKAPINPFLMNTLTVVKGVQENMSSILQHINQQRQQRKIKPLGMKIIQA